MRKITTLLTALAALLSFSFTSFAEAEAVLSEEQCTVTENGNILFIDEVDLLTDNEESYVRSTIADAVAEKGISVGVVATETIKQEMADFYYTVNGDPDFALMLFNDSEYAFYFYGNAETEFAGDADTFWMTESYMDGDAYFAAALQFPLDIRYHTPDEIIPEETTEAVTEDIPEEEISVEAAEDGIYTVKTENGCVALLHDLDNSIPNGYEAEIVSELIDAVQEKDFSICIVITDDIGSDKSDYGVMDFADVYYEEYCGINTDGILLLINNDTKYDWISTSGGCIDMYADAIDPIFDALYDYLVDGNYSLAAQRFVQEVRYYSEQEYVYYDDYDYYFDSEEIEGIFSVAIFGIIAAVISVSIFAGSISSSYKMKKNVTAANYKLTNSLVFTQDTDTYLRTYTTRRRVSSSSSSGGGRSGGGRSHRSSGGGRHGGGGRRR